MKYAFDVPIRVIVEAPSLNEAAGELIGLEMLTVGTDGPLEIRSVDSENVGWVRACRVCGCTDDQACEDGCSWLPVPESDGEGGLCSNPDDAHAAALDEIEKALAGATS